MTKSYRQARAEWQRRYLLDVVTAASGNFVQAAKIARVNRDWFYRHCRKLGLMPDVDRIRKRAALRQLAQLDKPALRPSSVSRILA
jgi:hypothetical protein